MSDELCAVDLKGIAEDRFGYHFVLLQDERGRQLPIWIGGCEAMSMTYKLRELPMPRPMTHDFVVQSIERLDGRITRVLIDDLWQNIFYAKLCVERDGEEVQVDCRPSDGLALAVRVEVPILVRDDVMEEGKVAQPLPDGPGTGDDAKPTDEAET